MSIFFGEIFLNFGHETKKSYFLIYQNLRKIYKTVFTEQKITNTKKTDPTSSLHFLYIVRLVFQINHKNFKNFDRRKLKISKENSKIATILKMSCYHGNKNI